MRIVKLADIRIDGGTQCRVVIDQPTVYIYVENMKDGDVFPALETVFDGSSYWLTDGFHRYHAYKLLGIKEVQTEYKPGTLQDAQLIALQANSTHGKPLTNEDKRNKVRMALEIEGFDQKTDYEIAKLCKVSNPFVAAIRDPIKKQKQAEDKLKHVTKKAQEIADTINQINSDDPKIPNPNTGNVPDEEEIKASEAAVQAYMEEIESVMQSDDKLAEANEVIKKQAHRIAQLESRMRGLMNEKNEAIKMVKQLQKEIDRIKDKK